MAWHLVAGEGEEVAELSGREKRAVDIVLKAVEVAAGCGRDD